MKVTDEQVDAALAATAVVMDRLLADMAVLAGGHRDVMAARDGGDLTPEQEARVSAFMRGLDERMEALGKALFNN